MDQQAFESFVNENIDLLKGVRPETNDDLDRYGKELGFRLPQSVKWLLATHGYSMACGIENLEDSVKTTSECRKTISLPSNIFIINDWNDGGVVFAIVEERPRDEYEIVWGDTTDLYQIIDGKALGTDIERFASFSGWVVDRVRFERENA